MISFYVDEGFHHYAVSSAHDSVVVGASVSAEAPFKLRTVASHSLPTRCFLIRIHLFSVGFVSSGSMRPKTRSASAKASSSKEKLPHFDTGNRRDDAENSDDDDLVVNNIEVRYGDVTHCM